MPKLTGKDSRLKVSEFKLTTLLEITNAINSNLPENELFVLFKYILEHQLNIGKALVFLRQQDTWQHALSYGVSDDELAIDVETDLAGIEDITVMEMMGQHQSKSFDVVIPVFHHKHVIAHLLLGDIDEQELRTSPIIKHLPFIQTLANITVVAIENMRLVEQSLKQKVMQREMEMASEMQGLLLPNDLPNNGVIQAAALYMPHQEVGGDFYDVIKVNDDEFVICMSDVSGKGISAAILMASFQANLRGLMQREQSLMDLVKELNDRVWDDANGERFITMFLAKYNSKTRVLEYINAAHPPPMLINNGKGEKLENGCVGLGMFETFPFISTGEVKLNENAVLMVYTDGLSEVEDANAIFYDENKLEGIALEDRTMSMDELNSSIMHSLNLHRGEIYFSDDIALVSCRFI